MPAVAFRQQRGFTLIEILVTIIVLAIGLLGIASLTSKVQVAQVESYQRAQAVLLLEDMLARINANRGNAPSYVTTDPVGYDISDPAPATCAGTPGATLDLCEWSNALKGASEASSGGTAVGGMQNARGCVEQLQAPDPTPGTCIPGVYRVIVVWQGMNATATPSLVCGDDADYGGGAFRRAIAAETVIGLNSCEPS